jgi:ribosomal protein S18 acetylase RimI-like enzyme
MSTPEQRDELVLRRGTPDDDEGFWRCLDTVARERRFLAMVAAPPLEHARAFLAEARERGIVQFLALDEAHVVGWCDIAPKPLEGFRHVGTLGMGLLADQRGRGLGGRLLALALSGARERGLARIELEVYGSNDAAIRLYRRAGFVSEGCKRAARILDGRVDDIECMALALPPAIAARP